MKLLDSKALSTVLALAGLVTASGYVNADNAASAYTEDGNAVIGAVAALAGAVDGDGFTKVLSTELSNSGTPKDLVIGLSFETSLFTMTMVKSKNGNKSTSTADAEIEMYVLVDGQMAAPGIVTFDKRRQELWASLGGVLDCTDANSDGIISLTNAILLTRRSDSFSRPRRRIPLIFCQTTSVPEATRSRRTPA